MVDLAFISRLEFFVPLSLLRSLAALTTPPSSLPYFTSRHLDGIKNMNLLNRGRLSVQPVEDVAWEAVELLGTKGGWEEMIEEKGAKKKRTVKRRHV